MTLFDDCPVITAVEDVAENDVVDLCAALKELQQNYPESPVDDSMIALAEDVYFTVQVVECDDSDAVLYCDQMNVAFPLGTLVPVVGKEEGD